MSRLAEIVRGHTARGLGTAFAAVALLTLPTMGAAQVASGGAAFQYYEFKDAEVVGLESFSLLTTPFSVGVPLGSRFALDVSGAYARGLATGTEGQEAEMAGPVDTNVGFSLLLGQDRVVLSSSVTLPTGEEIRTLEQSTVAGVVAAELLPFGISTWGSGGGAGGDLAFAFQAGRLGVGVSGGYWAAREFDPIGDSEVAYRPGDQIRARVAFDLDVGTSGTVSLLLGLQSFEEDQFGGLNLFRSGERYEGLFSYSFAAGPRGSGQFYTGVYHREEGALLLEAALDGATGSASQQLFTGGFGFFMPVGRRAVLRPDMNLRVFRSGDGVGQGWVATAGGTLDLRVSGTAFGRNVTLSPHAKVRYGRVVVRTDSESNILGWDFGLSLRTGAGS